MLFLSWNCANGLVNKIDNVRVVVEKFIPEIAFIQESNLKDQQIGPCQIKGYDLLTSNTLLSGCSRIACYKKRGSQFKQLKVQNDTIDLIILESDFALIIGLYRGFKIYDGSLPKDHFQKYLTEIERNLKINKELIIMGDFNIDPRRDINKWNGRMLEDFVLSQGLIQHVKGNTRKRIVLKSNGQYQTQMSQIDLVLSKNILNIKVSKKSDYVSDHSIIITECSHLPRTPHTTKLMLRDNTKLKEYNILQEAFKAQNIHNLHDLNNLHLSIYEKLAPLRSIRIRDPQQVINPRIEKIKKKGTGYINCTKNLEIKKIF